jgi:hypothetical protein
MRISRQVLPQRTWYSDHGLAGWDPELVQDLRVSHGVALYEEVLAILVQPRRTGLTCVAAEEP